MPEQRAFRDDYYDLTLRLRSDCTPFKPMVSPLSFSVDDLSVMGQLYETRGRKRVARRHFACIASTQVQTDTRAAYEYLIRQLMLAPELNKPGLYLI